jgi:hypothetical protein
LFVRGSARSGHNRELAASLRRFYFLKAEVLVELVVRLTVDLDIRVGEVIERWTILLRRPDILILKQAKAEYEKLQ